jgi:hypothetical protein
MLYLAGGAAIILVAIIAIVVFAGGSEGRQEMVIPADANSVGPLDAAVTIVEFGDFQ